MFIVSKFVWVYCVYFFLFILECLEIEKFKLGINCDRLK